MPVLAEVSELSPFEIDVQLELKTTSRFCHEESLGVFHTEASNGLQFFHRLHPFGDDARPDLFRHSAESLHNVTLDDTSIDTAHHVHVEFQIIGLEVDDLLQPRVPGAHVVDGGGEAHIREVPHFLEVRGVVLDSKGLCHFQNDAIGMQIAAVEQVEQKLAAEVRVS